MKKLKKKSENTSGEMKIKLQLPQPIRCSKSSSMREIYTNTDTSQEIRHISRKETKLPT